VKLVAAHADRKPRRQGLKGVLGKQGQVRGRRVVFAMGAHVDSAANPNISCSFFDPIDFIKIFKGLRPVYDMVFW